MYIVHMCITSNRIWVIALGSLWLLIFIEKTKIAIATLNEYKKVKKRFWLSIIHKMITYQTMAQKEQTSKKSMTLKMQYSYWTLLDYLVQLKMDTTCGKELLLLASAPPQHLQRKILNPERVDFRKIHVIFTVSVITKQVSAAYLILLRTSLRFC